MRSFTSWVLHHRKTVVVAWILVAVAAFASVSASVDALSDEFELPGRESTDAANAIYDELRQRRARVSTAP